MNFELKQLHASVFGAKVFNAVVNNTPTTTKLLFSQHLYITYRMLKTYLVVYREACGEGFNAVEELKRIESEQ